MSQQPESSSSDRDALRAARRARRRERRETRGAVLGLILVVVGVAFLLQSLDVWTVRGDVIWPLILIALGGWIALRRFIDGDRSPDED
ncbi:MAG: DUF5668 domain-containing protein [Dehalococcoidia bacterium]